MKLQAPSIQESCLPSAEGRQRLLSRRFDPVFHADWLDAVFLHFETNPAVLQRGVPWELDLFEGRAFVSLVAFTMRDMRPIRGGRLAALPFRPIATHEFLNVRTYVKHGGEPGIYFLKEWLPNRLSVALGPGMFGLPYQLGRMDYDHDMENGVARGRVEDVGSGKTLVYSCEMDEAAVHAPCAAGSLEEFLVERYTAFTSVELPLPGRPLLRRLFRIWHPPWDVVPLTAQIEDRSLLSLTGDWSHDARLVSAHHSPGVRDVWMGRPHFARRA
jgi:uncharacterized protein YqjF (DUF2071 family)